MADTFQPAGNLENAGLLPVEGTVGRPSWLPNQLAFGDNIALGWRQVCSWRVSVPDTCAQSRWDWLPHLLVIMVHASLGHSTEPCVMPLFPRGGQVQLVE